MARFWRVVRLGACRGRTSSDRVGNNVLRTSLADVQSGRKFDLVGVLVAAGEDAIFPLGIQQPIDLIGASAGANEVAAGAPLENVSPGVAVEPVEARLSQKYIVPGIAAKDVLVVSPDERVIIGIAGKPAPY